VAAAPPDPGLEAEFLRRLMVRFGRRTRARGQLAASKDDGRAKIVRLKAERADSSSPNRSTAPGGRGLVLDRVASPSKTETARRFYFVRYVDPEADALDKKNDSFLAKLMFWRSAPDPKAEQYRVFVKDRNDSSEVQVSTRKAIRIPPIRRARFSPCCSNN